MQRGSSRHSPDRGHFRAATVALNGSWQPRTVDIPILPAAFEASASISCGAFNPSPGAVDDPLNQASLKSLCRAEAKKCGCLGLPPFLGRDDFENEARVQERSILQHPLQKLELLAQRCVVRLQGLDLANRV